jgi:hypothetical protein
MASQVLIVDLPNVVNQVQRPRNDVQASLHLKYIENSIDNKGLKQFSRDHLPFLLLGFIPVNYTEYINLQVVRRLCQHWGLAAQVANVTSTTTEHATAGNTTSGNIMSSFLTASI